MSINRKYIIAGMLATASLVPLSDVTHSHAAEIRITTTRVNFRTGPDTSFSSMGVLNGGVKVAYLSESENWTKVEYNSKIGYICSDYLEMEQQPSSTKTSTNTMYVTPSVGLNLRRGAGTSYSVIKTLSKGTPVTVLSTDNNWSEISVNGLKGYVSSAYLSSTNPSNSNEVTPNKASTMYVNVNCGLNLRQGASTNYPVIATLPKGTQVTVYSTDNNWCKVSANNMSGYVSSTYLSSTKPNSNSGFLRANTFNSSPTNVSVDDILNFAESHLGKPYVWGATGPNAFDCSGLTQYVYKHAANINIPRTSYLQGRFGTTVSINNLKAGDLVFFDTNGINDGNISHVGIYAGNGQLIHASYSSKKIVKVSMQNSYWYNTFVTAKRILY